MPKVELDDVLAAYEGVSRLNANFDAIENAFDRVVFRDGTAPNAMQSNLDLNGFDIVNFGAATVEAFQGPPGEDGLDGTDGVDGAQGPPGDISKAANVAAVAAVAGPAANSALYLVEPDQEGLFIFDSSDLSANITADTPKGLYIAPAAAPTGASGAWVRKVDGPINPLWFGVVEGDAAGANGAANSAALSALFATLRTRANNVSTNYQDLETIRFPPGHFEFAETIDITEGTPTLEGDDTGHTSARGTKLVFPAGVTGIRVQRFDTSGHDTVDGVTHRGGDGVIIRNLSLFGGYDDTETEGEFHGIHLRARATLQNFYIQKFEGDGIYSDVVASEGNSNNARISNGRIQSCRNGMFLNGPDANIWTIISIDVSGNRAWGIKDSSFLGNTYLGCHAATNGLIEDTIPTVVTHGGNRYGVIAGQEVGASTNAPSGTIADNTWWYYISSGAASPSNNIAAWLTGTTYRAGGSYYTDDGNARNWFGGCYHESGQGKAQLISPTQVYGGMLANSVHGTAVVHAVDSGIALNKGGYRSSVTDVTSTREVTLGSGTEKETLLFFKDTVQAPNTYRLKFNGADLQLDYQASNSNRPFLISGPLTTQQLGTGAAAPHFLVSEKFAVGDTLTNARRISNGTVVPASGAHGRGEFFFKRDPNLGGPLGWHCHTAGTPGSWTEFYSGLSPSPTVGIGYVTGAGGAVTQGTSKSTGVTRNTVTGQITMHNAALAAGVTVSFTFTNSTIAATDVIIINIGSGATADSYKVGVTAVAAGSCRIQLTNISAGSLGEALVLNYAVIKGVAA